MKDNDKGAGAAPDISIAPDRMEGTFDELIAALPELDTRQVASLVESMKLFPASGKRLMMKKLINGSPAEQALAYDALRAYGQGAVDDLNAVVFDTGASKEAKVRADELLAELGSPIDRDVLEMSVEDPDALLARSPRQAVRDFEAGKSDEAAARLRELPEDVRAVLIHRLVEIDLPKALALFGPLCGDAPTALAVVSALSQGGEGGVDLLQQLAGDDDRTVQKSARRALHTMRAAGIDVPDDQPEPEAPPEEAPEEPGEKAPPIYKCVVVFTEDKLYAAVNVARQYPNGRLQVLSTVVDFFKRGIRGSRYWLDMSKSRFKKLLSERSGGTAPRDVTLDEARAIVARGIRVAREVGTPIPFDFQTGKHVLGDVMAEAKAIDAPFACPECGGALAEDQLKRIKDAAPYEQLRVETRCEKCRS